MAEEVGIGYVSIIPEVQGFAGELQRQIVGPSADAGAQGGQAAGGGFVTGLKTAVKAGVAAVGVAAGALFVKGFGNSLEQGQITGKLKGSLGATSAEAGRYGKVAGKLYSGAVSDSFEDAAAAIKGIAQKGLLPPGATQAQLKTVATGLSDVGRIMEADVGEVARAVGKMMKTGLAKDATEAMDILTKGVQGGANEAEDLLELFNEYSTQFRTLGLDGQTAMGLITQGLKGGARDADIVADFFKEFAIEAVAGSDKIRGGYKLVGLDADRMFKMLGQGGPAAREALAQTLDALRAIEDPVKRNAAAVELFGTKAEDMGDAWLKLDPRTAAAGIGEVTGATQQLGTDLRDNAGAQLEIFKRTIEQTATEIVGGKIIPGLLSAGRAARDVLGPAVRETGQFIRGEVLPAAREFGGYLADNLGPAAQQVGDIVGKYLLPPARWLKDVAVDLGPPLRDVGMWLGGVLLDGAEKVGRFVVEKLVPGFADLLGWLDRNKTTIGIVAGVIATLLLPVIITMGVAATISAGQSIAAFFAMSAGWIAQGVQAVISGGLTIGIWGLMAASAISGAASSVAAAYRTVGGWILMGTQSLIQGARMAAAWLLAMGPVPLIIAAVVGLVALIVLNWDTIVGATKAAFEWVWSKILTVFDWVKNLFLNFTGPGLIIKHWDSIKSATGQAFDWVRDKISTVLDAVQGSFRTAVDGIGRIWDGVREIAAAPVRFVINTVYNDGIRAVWNFIASKVGLGQLDRVNGFARGGIYPGYTPGRDVGIAAVSGGEAIMRPEWTRAVGPDYVHSMNALARGGGVGAVRAALGGQFAGAYSLGGIVGKVKDGIKKLPGVGAVVDKIGEVVRGGLVKAAELGLKPVRSLIDQMPGSPDWALAGKKLPLNTIDGVLKKLKGEDDKALAEGGGTGVLPGNPGAALLWAMSKRGLPYQWGGTGPLYDCSGLTQWAYRQVGYMLGRTTYDQVKQGRRISKADALPGDLVFEHFGGRSPSHVGFYVNPSTIWDAPRTGSFVGYSPMSNVTEIRRYLDPSKLGTHDSGGWLGHRQLGLNMSGRPEAVLTDAQWRVAEQALIAGNRRLPETVLLRLEDGSEFRAFVEDIAGDVADRDGRDLANGRRY